MSTVPNSPKQDLISFLQFVGAIVVGFIIGYFVVHDANGAIQKIFIYMGATLFSGGVYIITNVFKNLNDDN